MTALVTSNTAWGPRTYTSINQLSDVKQGIYNPVLPTLRRMDMDSNAQKMPDEHCRTTTRLSRGDFDSATVTLLQPPSAPLFCTDITSTGKSIIGLSGSHAPEPLESDGPVEAENPNKPAKYTGSYLGHLPIRGYQMRFKSPTETGAWKVEHEYESELWPHVTVRRSLTSGPTIDMRGRRPQPTNSYSASNQAQPFSSQHRSHVNLYGSQVASKSWCPANVGSSARWKPMNDQQKWTRNRVPHFEK